MSGYDSTKLPSEAVALRLHRLKGDTLISCEMVSFDAGWAGVDTILRRGAISGRVEVGGDFEHHFADIHSANGDLLETVALNRGSYNALKNRWMRCRIMDA